MLGLNMSSVVTAMLTLGLDWSKGIDQPDELAPQPTISLLLTPWGRGGTVW